MNTRNKIASEITKRNGGKVKTRLPQVREDLKLLVDMSVEFLKLNGFFIGSPLEVLEKEVFDKYEKHLAKLDKKKQALKK